MDFRFKEDYKMKIILKVLFLVLLFTVNVIIFFSVVHSSLTADQCLLTVFMSGLISVILAISVVGE